MATRVGYAEVVQGNLRRAAQEISGRPADPVRQRMTLTNLAPAPAALAGPKVMAWLRQNGNDSPAPVEPGA